MARGRARTKRQIDKQFEEESRRFKSYVFFQGRVVYFSCTSLNLCVHVRRHAHRTTTKTDALYKEAKTYLDSVRGTARCSFDVCGWAHILRRAGPE